MKMSEQQLLIIRLDMERLITEREEAILRAQGQEGMAETLKNIAEQLGYLAEITHPNHKP